VLFLISLQIVHLFCNQSRNSNNNNYNKQEEKGQKFSNNTEEYRNHTEATQNGPSHTPPNVAAEQENGKK
jgi:hypothetical protein